MRYGPKPSPWKEALGVFLALFLITMVVGLAAPWMELAAQSFLSHARPWYRSYYSWVKGLGE